MYRFSLCLAVIGLPMFCSASAWAVESDEKKGILPETSLEDVPMPLEPIRPRTEAQQDRITASALFAHGRVLLRRENYAGALRRFQRAWRYDPTEVSILSDIFQLAVELKRYDEAARYGVLAAELDPQAPISLHRMAEQLTRQQDFQRALGLYEKSLERHDEKSPEGLRVLVGLEMGRLYFLTGEFKKSAESFALVRDALIDPSRHGLNEELKESILGDAQRTYALFAEAFYQADRLQAAEEYFRKANEAKPNEGLLALHLARLEAKRKDTDAALENLERYFAFGESSGGAEPYQLLTELIEKKLGDKKKADQEIEVRLTKLYKDKPNAALGYFLAQRARESERLELAEGIYKELLKENPTVNAYQGLVDIYRSRGEIENLLDTLGQAVAKTKSLEPLGAEVDKVTEDDNLIGMLIDTASTRQQNDTKSLGEGVKLAVGLLATKAKRFDDADKFFELALQEPQAAQDQLMLTWGLDLFMAEQYDRAAAVFQRAIDENVAEKDNLEFHFFLTGALEMAGRTEEALVAAQEAIQLRPKSPRLQSRLAWIKYHAKRHQEAEKSYRDLIERFDTDYESPGVREAVREARLVLSNICVLQERMPEAEEWLEQVLDEFPEDIGALNDLGYLWADQNKRLHRSLDMVRKAVKNDPDNVAYRDSLGWAYFRLGRFEEAVRELEKAAEDDNPDGVILDHLGDAYHQNKQSQKALAAWQRAVEAFIEQDDYQLLDKTKAKIKKLSAE